jgi:hypothetical protein
MISDTGIITIQNIVSKSMHHRALERLREIEAQVA